MTPLPHQIIPIHKWDKHFIIGGRCCGKTEALIEYCKALTKERVLILTPSESVFIERLNKDLAFTRRGGKYYTKTDSIISLRSIKAPKYTDVVRGHLFDKIFIDNLDLICKYIDWRLIEAAVNYKPNSVICTSNTTGVLGEVYSPRVSVSMACLPHSQKLYDLMEKKHG